MALCALAYGASLALACGDDDVGEPSANDTTATSLADALTNGVRFMNGRVKLGALAASSDDTVRLIPADDLLRLQPGDAALLAFDVDNAKSGEPVEAVLMQFADADSYIDVAQAVAPAAAPVPVSLKFTVDDAVCEGLCAARLEITMTQAVRLSNGEVGETSEVTVELDCTKRGKPEACPAAMLDAGTDAGKFVADAGATPTSVTALAAELSTTLAAAHDALCTSCTDPNRIPCYAIVPLGAITCIENALLDLVGTPELFASLQGLIEDVKGVTEACGSCDLGACVPTVLDDTLALFPVDAATVISACVDPNAK